MSVWLLFTSPAAAYSVLTIRAVIDPIWERSLLPLRRRYPRIHLPADSATQLEAKSYAYGGAVGQDMGYYPLGAEFFTDVTHNAPGILWATCCARRIP